MFSLVVDGFGVQYVGKQHADHLVSVLQKYHDITMDWPGNKYVGIYLKWDYITQTFRFTMDT